MEYEIKNQVKDEYCSNIVIGNGNGNNRNYKSPFFNNNNNKKKKLKTKHT